MTQHIDASQFTEDQHLEADIVIIGSGAGGGIAAEQLAQAGLKVLLLEEGAYYTHDDFVMEERWAYPNLYQEGAGRKTRDQAISILQGRTVGGSTTVNWTTSIRTPQPTLDYWQSEFGLNFSASNDLTPYFVKAEQRLNIRPWPVPPNGNNSVIKRGCEALGWQHTIISRNVNGCANLGYCGMGCPINGKQSMLVSTIPAALALGAMLISRLSVRKFTWQGDSISGIDAVPVNQYFQPRNDIRIGIKAKHYILAAGAIGSPA
ncbi:GMC family oxidoreductase N-terminal domain-containing protein, partial [Arsukibacterium sp. UBA4203]